MRTEIRHSFLTMFIVLIQATLASAQFIRQPATTSLEVENRTLDGLLVSSDFASSVGGTVVARYSTYSVIRVPQTALAAVNNAATAKHIVFRQRDDFDRIYLASRVVDTLNEPSPNPAVADYPSATHGLYVLQFMAPLQPAWRSDVEKAGARLLGYLPNNAYLVDATPETAALLRKVSSVQWLNPLSPKDKNQEFTSVTTADADLWVDIADMPGADQVLRMIAARNVGETFQSGAKSDPGALSSYFGGRLRDTRAAFCHRDFSYAPRSPVKRARCPRPHRQRRQSRQANQSGYVQHLAYQSLQLLRKPACGRLHGGYRGHGA